MPVRLKKRYLLPAVILIAGAVALFILKQRRFKDLEPLVGDQLKALVKAGSDGLYTLQFDSIYTDFNKNDLYLQNIVVRPDSTVLKRKEQNKELGNDVFIIHINSLKLANISINDLVKGRGINLKTLEIDKPQIQFYHKSRHNGLNEADDEDESLNLYQKIRKRAKRVQVNSLKLKDVAFTYVNQNKGNKVTKIDHVDLLFSDIEINERTQTDKNRFFFAKDASIRTDEFSYATSDSLYLISWDSINIQAAQRQMEIVGLHYHPRKEKNITTALSGKNQYDLELQKLLLKNIDWWSLAWEEGFTADSAILQQGNFSIYNNKADVIRKNKKGNFPHQLLQAADMPIHIKALKIDDLNFRYEDLNYKSGRTGTIFLDNIQGAGTNISNLHSGTSERYIKLYLNTLFMHIAPLHMNLYFDLQNVTEGNFKANIVLNKLDVSKLNTITEPLGMLHVNSLFVDKLAADIDGNNNGAHANVIFRFDDLNVALLKKNKLTAEMKERKFFTYIANNVLFKRSNLNEPVTVAHADYKRTINQSFFGLLWRTLLSGIAEAAKKN